MPYRLSLSLLLALSTLSLFVLPAWPHGGGLDKYGCHHNHVHGGYHCHRGALEGGMFDSKAEMLQALKGKESDPAITARPTRTEALQGCEEHVTYGVPSHSGVLLCRVGYALSFNTDHKVADWVAYHLTREKMLGTVPRSDNFRPDPDLAPATRSELADYRGSGFDRGHLAPAAAMKWDARAMSDSFLLSNMAPQVGAGFNRGIWRVLEAKVRHWTTDRGELYVVTGPIYASDELMQIGPNQVSVPTHFYKVIFDPIRVEAIAFILPNERRPSTLLPTFIESIDRVEAQTGLDFLPELEDSVENLIEARVQSSTWDRR